MTDETWKAVPGYEGLYEASTLGKVRSLDRYVADKRGRKRFKKGLVLAGGPHLGGYQTIHLHKDGERWATVRHIVVAVTFLPPRPSPDHEVRHRDGDKANCQPANLAWGTHEENEADKDRHGTRLRGERVGGAKLDSAAVRAIRERAGEPQQDLADEFGCTLSNISAIQLRKSWRHV